MVQTLTVEFLNSESQPKRVFGEGPYLWLITWVDEDELVSNTLQRSNFLKEEDMYEDLKKEYFESDGPGNREDFDNDEEYQEELDDWDNNWDEGLTLEFIGTIKE